MIANRRMEKGSERKHRDPIRPNKPLQVLKECFGFPDVFQGFVRKDNIVAVRGRPMMDVPM
jgi:hypothetical protein